MSSFINYLGLTLPFKFFFLNYSNMLLQFFFYVYLDYFVCVV